MWFVVKGIDGNRIDVGFVDVGFVVVVVSSQSVMTQFLQQGIGIRGLLDSFSYGKKVLSGRHHLSYAVTDVFRA
nr:hypothetical protein [Tanacetum cinerariifolium]